MVTGEPALVNPTTIAEISAAICDAPGAVVFNVGVAEHPFGMPTLYRRFRALDAWKQAPLSDDELNELGKLTAISLDEYTGIVEHDADDQVVVFRGGTSISEVQDALWPSGQCLPFPPFLASQAGSIAQYGGPLIDEIGFNLPHGLSNQCGSWRDWILGMKVVTADGTVVKCGSKAVKNVAGYDVQKLMIGARGTLGLIAEVTLKTFPVKALPNSEVKFVPRKPVAYANWIQRVLPSDFMAALEADNGQVIAVDKPSSTIWAKVPAEESMMRFDGDWVMRAGYEAKNLEFVDSTMIRLMKRAKELIDPSHKLNPGEMGIFRCPWTSRN